MTFNIYNGPKSDEWRTPHGFYSALNDRFDFSHDLAATKENAKAPLFFTKENDALQKNWNRIKGNCWLNPPFSLSTEFFKKASESKNKIVAIYKAANMETEVWQKYIFPFAKVHVLSKRLNYEIDGEQKNGVTFGSALIFYRVNFKSQWLPEGTTLAKVIRR
ncbi:hypothetical protein EBT16_10495 [bacterium]|nr:hypothetical protein [bacterium]